MNTNDKKPAVFTPDIFTAIPCSGGSYLRAPGNVRIFYGQIAAVIAIHFPKLIDAHALAQIAAMPGAQSWFDKSKSPFSIPYSFSDEARFCAAATPPPAPEAKQDEAPAARDIIAELEQKIADDLEKIDREARFDAMLDECYSFEKVGGPFANMQPSDILKNCDPAAYRCGVNDYADGEGWIEVGSDNYDPEEVEEKRDELIEELENEIEDLEEERDEELAEEHEDEAARNESDRIVAENNTKIAALKGCIARLKNHSF